MKYIIKTTKAYYENSYLHFFVCVFVGFSFNLDYLLKFRFSSSAYTTPPLSLEPFFGYEKGF